MGPHARRLVVLTFAISLFGALRPAGGAEPPPPSDAEITKFVAIHEALASDPGRADEICAEIAEAAERDSAEGEDLAAIGRRAEASPILGPQLRRHSLGGRRYAEMAVQVGAVLIGAAIADAADAAERRPGKTGKNRAALLASSPAAPPILARQADLTRTLQKLESLCADDESDDESMEEDG